LNDIKALIKHERLMPII